MTRDAFDKRAETVSSDGWSGDAFAVSVKDTAKLLRAQHRAFVRLVRGAAGTYGDFGIVNVMKRDLLAALRARWKGGRR